jgi:hypothetical protein
MRMRTFLLSIAVSAALASPAGAATRNFGINSFEKVRVEGPFIVKLTTGVAPFATASGSSAAIDKVAIDVRGNTLVVHSNLSSSGGYPGQNSGPVEISIGTHDLSSAWTSGSGSLSIDKVRGLSFDLSVQGSASATIGTADVDQLQVAVVGSGNARLAGRAGKLTAVVRGIGTLDASNLAAKDATIGAEGAATVTSSVSNSATIDANGPATLTFTGNPACTIRGGSSATVTGCKATQ